MQDQLFANQNSFGLKPWSEFATSAGVPDLQAFDACTKQETPVQRIETGKKAGEQLDIRSTPSIIINGWKLAQPPTEAQLQDMIRAALEGKKPV
jgi:protein-disulfide isomerase